jgi:predicted transcriptional regulator
MFTQADGQVATGIEKVRYSHDAMIDIIIATPWVRQKELAQRFGLTQAWVSQVVNSDSFKKRLEERKNELVDPSIVQSIEEGFQGLCRMSMSVLMEKLEAAPDPKIAVQTLNVAARALGFGARPEQPTQVNNWFQQIIQQNNGHQGLIKTPEAGKVVATVEAPAVPLPAATSQSAVPTQLPALGALVNRRG